VSAKEFLKAGRHLMKMWCLLTWLAVRVYTVYTLYKVHCVPAGTAGVPCRVRHSRDIRQRVVQHPANSRVDSAQHQRIHRTAGDVRPRSTHCQRL